MLSIVNVKNVRDTFLLDTVNYITGRNGTGKSALLEAVRLAVNNASEAGPSKNKFLAGANASVTLDTESQQYTWQPGNKTPKGQQVLSANDFWKLSGEEKWQLLSRNLQFVVHGETLSDDTINQHISQCEQTVRQLRTRLGSAPTVPQPYHGRPRSILAPLLSDITQRYSAASNARKDRQSILSWREYQNNSVFKLERANSDLYLNNLRLEKDIRNLAHDIEQLQQYLATERRSKRQIIEDSLGKIFQQDPANANCRFVRSAVDAFMDLVESLDVVPEVALPAVRCALPCADYAESLSLLRAKLADTEDALRKGQAEAIRNQHEVDQIWSSIAQHELEFGEIPGDDEYQKLVAEYSALNQEMESLLQYEAGITAHETFQKSVQSINDIVSVEQDKLHQLLSIRQKVIDEHLSQVQLQVNLMLAQCGRRMSVLLSASFNGRTRSLNITTSDGIDFSALNGAAKCIIGSLLLLALQQSSQDFPIVLIEAAELDETTISKLLSALQDHVVRGLVMVASWVPTDVPGINVIQLV